MNWRIGITMRVTNATGYHEVRDSLARDWTEYMQNAFPDAQWMYIPNMGIDAVNYFRKWDLNVLILTGGDDIGDYPDRDQTESELLRHALENNIPVIGVCRGLQLIHRHFGGEMKQGDESFTDVHRAQRHEIEMDGSAHEVNSYHNNMLDETTLHHDLQVIARCSKDNTIEGVRAKGLMAMMWHPEREERVEQWNLNLIKDFLDQHE